MKAETRKRYPLVEKRSAQLRQKGVDISIIHMYYITILWLVKTHYSRMIVMFTSLILCKRSTFSNCYTQKWTQITRRNYSLFIHNTVHHINHTYIINNKKIKNKYWLKSATRSENGKRIHCTSTIYSFIIDGILSCSQALSEQISCGCSNSIISELL